MHRPPRFQQSPPRLDLGAAAIAAFLALVSPAAAADQPAAREQVGKPVQQAQALVKQKKYADALARLREADAVPDKSPYELYIIAETRAAATLDSGDYPAAATALEAVLATGFLAPPESAKRIETLAEIDYRLKDYAKTIAAANRYYKDGGTDPAPRLLMAQSFYLEGAYEDAAKTIRDILRAGAAPDESLLLTLASAEFKTQNQAGYIDALARLVASHPKQQYWSDLLRAVQQRPGFAPRLRLDLDRLAVAAGSFTTPDQYVEAAERALAAGYPGDAKAFLERGTRAGVLGQGAQAERQKRLADMARRQSDDDAKSLPQLAKDADAAPDGTALEKLGEAYASYGRYPDAIAALDKAVAKGGLKNPDDARLHLGVAYLRAGHAAQAKTALRSLTATDGAQDLARLWLIAGGAG